MMRSLVLAFELETDMHGDALNDDFIHTEFILHREKASIHMPCVIEEKHQCTPSSHRYGFHDLRREFATANEGRISDRVLQALMRHKDLGTTQKYIEIPRKTRSAADDLYVPPILQQPKPKREAN